MGVFSLLWLMAILSGKTDSRESPPAVTARLMVVAGSSKTLPASVTVPFTGDPPSSTIVEFSDIPMPGVAADACGMRRLWLYVLTSTKIITTKTTPLVRRLFQYMGRSISVPGVHLLLDFAGSYGSFSTNPKYMCPNDIRADCQRDPDRCNRCCVGDVMDLRSKQIAKCHQNCCL